MDKDLQLLQTQQLANKLYIAGADDYDKIWIRDNAYIALALLEADLVAEAAATLSALLAIIALYENKLDQTAYPVGDSEILQPRFTISGAEVGGQWSNRQHDAVGILLFSVGRLYDVAPSYVSQSEQDLCQKLVRYLERCRYWEDPDNGMWEESPAILHASSLAAAIGGIEAVSSFCNLDVSGLAQARDQLEALLPRESADHAVDMAQLSLLWPLGYQDAQLLHRIEKNLLRTQGVIRFQGDAYESADGQESEWVMGIPWLGIARFEIGDVAGARHYLAETEKLYTADGLPESYGAQNIACAHTPLAWSHAMVIVLRAKLARSDAPKLSLRRRFARLRQML